MFDIQLDSVTQISFVEDDDDYTCQTAITGHVDNQM